MPAKQKRQADDRMERRVQAVADCHIEQRQTDPNDPNSSKQPVLAGLAIPYGKESRRMANEDGQMDVLEEGEEFVEVIDPGAAKNVLTKGPDVRCVINHSGGLQTLGRTSSGTLKLDERADGVHYECPLPKTQAGRDIEELVKRGDIRNNSFAFTVKDDGQVWSERADGTPVRHITEFASLHDVCPVDNPAYEDTRCAIRGLHEFRSAHPKAGATKPSGDAERCALRVKLAQVGLKEKLAAATA